MSWAIDPPVRAGSFTFSAIVETDISVQVAGTGLIGHGLKRPLLFLLEREGEVSVIDMNAQAHKVEELEGL
jgi:hypothetical protein